MTKRQIIIRDTWDPDIFHLGYSWDRPSLAKPINRTAATIHIDDINSMLGEDIYEAAKALDLGGMLDIEVSGRV